jgi:hypothetical protein
MMERKLKVNSPVVFMDAHRKGHHALITRVWDNSSVQVPDGCNLVYVSDDETKTDPYGRQIERETSVIHKSAQPAGGLFWCWPDEFEGEVI